MKTFFLKAISFLLFVVPNVAIAQSVSTQTNSGTVNSFTINAQSGFSVNTSATSTPGVTARAEGNLVLGANSSMATGVACTINCVGTFEQSNVDGLKSSSLNTSGSSSLQSIYIDPTSTFKTVVDTSTATQDDVQNSGSASSGLTSYTTLTVTEQTSQFANTIINTLQ